MGEPKDLQEVGERIEQLLDTLRAAIIPREYENVEELVRLVTELYGAGLERMLRLVDAAAPDVVDRVVADELVAGLLAVHGLHPHDLATRVEQALESVRPFLRHHDGDVELLEVDGELGAVHLRLLGSCDGCPSSSVTLEQAVERAIRDAAPEVSIIDVEAHAAVVVPAGTSDGRAVPVALRRKQGYDSCPTELAGVGHG